MPGDVPPRYCWDSCVLLSYINGVPQRVPVIDAMLQAARAGNVRIFVSTVSVTEVAYVQTEKLQRSLDKAEEHKLDSLWMDGTITPVEVDLLISRDARSLIREALVRGWRLRTPDAIHLATAQRLGVDEFNTYETRLLKYSDLIGRPVSEPRYPVQPSLFDNALEGS